MTVQAGDTLFTIADQYNVTVQAIIQANRLSSKQIYIGQKLILPEGASPTPEPSPTFDRRVFNKKVPPSPAQKLSPVEEEPITSSPVSRPIRHAEPDPRPRQQGALDLDLEVASSTAPETPTSPESEPKPKETRTPSSKPEVPSKPPLRSLPSSSRAQKGPQKSKTAPISPPKLVPKPQPGEPSSRPPGSKPGTPPPAPPPEWRPQARPPKSDPELEKPSKPPPERPSPRAGVQPPPAARATHKPHRETKASPSPHLESSAPLPALLPKERITTPETVPPPEPHVRRFPPEAIQGLYMAYHTLGNRNDRTRILRFIQQSCLNTLVIDLKNDRGYLSYRSQIPLAASLGANRSLVENMGQLLVEFKAYGVYTIARLVTFKDNLLASAYPDLAAKHPYTNEIWLDQQHIAWVDPFCQEVWDYNLQLATEAARLGFDEIQFDALRFPTPGLGGSPQFSQALNTEARLNAITGFLGAAQGLLAPLKVKIAVNLVGYACWREDDALVGHNIERLAPYLDVLSPILYPSAFPNGVPDYPHPLETPSEVVYQGARRAVERIKAQAPLCQIRPWLQDFQDYAFDERTFGLTEVQAQITGAVEGGAAGFMAWNPQTEYTQAAYLKAEA